MTAVTDSHGEDAYFSAVSSGAEFFIVRHLDDQWPSQYAVMSMAEIRRTDVVELCSGYYRTRAAEPAELERYLATNDVVGFLYEDWLRAKVVRPNRSAASTTMPRGQSLPPQA